MVKRVDLQWHSAVSVLVGSGAASEAILVVARGVPTHRVKEVEKPRRKEGKIDGERVIEMSYGRPSGYLSEGNPAFPSEWRVFAPRRVSLESRRLDVLNERGSFPQP